MLAKLPEKSIRTIRDAARRLTGAARRKFEAGVAIDYCQGSPRRTESVFGWGRATVKAGLDELQTGVARRDQFFKRGRRKTEEKLPDLEKDLDNGPEQASNRTQFIKRLLEFADKNGLVIELVYYPPYHSKYNSVERCWGILEQHWNGAILSSREAVLSWAQTMTWKGISPMVRLLETV